MYGCGILCTMRNCAPFLSRIFENFEKIGNIFNGNYIVLVYYDKSNDNTLELLNKYAIQNPKFLFYVNEETPLSPYRTHRIAKGRNFVLNKFRSDFPFYDYFVVMDCDNVCAYNLKTELFKNCLTRNDWDMLSFQHPSGYYDIWALSTFPFVLSCFLFRNSNLARSSLLRYLKRLRKNQLAYVLSAFNGFAIYRTRKFQNCYYDGRTRFDYIPKKWIQTNFRFAGPIMSKPGAEDCEHRYFHISAVLRNKARITIMPQTIFF
jgi:Glycosyl transferase family 2